MRIAMLTSWFRYPPSGSGLRFYEIARRLARRNQVHVYTGIAPTSSQSDTSVDNITVHACGSVRLGHGLERGAMQTNFEVGLRALSSLTRDHLAQRYDLVDCNITSKMSPFVCFLISRLRRTPIVQTWHEVWHKLIFSKYYAVYGNAALSFPGFLTEFLMPRVSDHCVAVSRTTKYRLINLLGVRESKITVIPNGVDEALLRSRPTQKESNTILYVGRLEPHKRVELLISAFKRLRQDMACKLLIIGDGSQYRNLTGLVSREHLDDVCFLGTLERQRLVHVLQSASVLVLPSLYEGQGIVLLEAMAAGTPVIAVSSTQSAVREVVIDGFNGLLADPDPTSLRDALFRLLTDSHLHKRLRANGLDYSSRYTWDVAASKTEDLYRSLIQGRSSLLDGEISCQTRPLSAAHA